MADVLLSAAPAGDMVECGTFDGGGSAKLSWLAELRDCKLYLCDSFAGLPDTGASDRVFRDLRRGIKREFSEGEYSAQLDLVRNNVNTHGRVANCEFVEGFFSDSLPALDVRPSFVFSDVDLISSTRDTLAYLWPRMTPGGYFFIHDTNFVELVEGFMDPTFWRDTLNEDAPILWGAGYGLGFGAGSISYLRKSK